MQSIILGTIGVHQTCRIPGLIIQTNTPVALSVFDHCIGCQSRVAVMELNFEKAYYLRSRDVLFERFGACRFRENNIRQS